MDTWLTWSPDGLTNIVYKYDSFHPCKALQTHVSLRLKALQTSQKRKQLNAINSQCKFCWAAIGQRNGHLTRIRHQTSSETRNKDLAKALPVWRHGMLWDTVCSFIYLFMHSCIYMYLSIVLCGRIGVRCLPALGKGGYESTTMFIAIYSSQNSNFVNGVEANTIRIQWQHSNNNASQ